MAFLKIRHKEKAGYSGGKYHDDEAFQDVLNYVLRPEKTPSGLIGGIAVNPRQAVYEMECLSRYFAQNNGVRLRHMILSFEQGELYHSYETSLHTAYDIAFEVAKFYGRSYQIVFAVHEDSQRIHVHFVMNMTNYLTGEKYKGKKGDLYCFIKYINSVLSPFDIEVKFLKDDEKAWC